MLGRQTLGHQGKSGQSRHAGKAAVWDSGGTGSRRNDGKVIPLPWQIRGRVASRLRAGGETGGWLSAIGSEWRRGKRDASIRERLRRIDPARSAWVEKATFCGDMVYVCMPMAELPERILQAAFDLNVEVFEHSVYELHLYEAALRILATGKWREYSEGTRVVERARQELSQLRTNRRLYYAEGRRSGDRAIRSYGAEDEMVVVLQDVGDGLRVVATTRIFRNRDPEPLDCPPTPGQGTPFDKCFRIRSLPHRLAERLEANGVTRSDLVEVGKLARRRNLSKADGLRAMAALYVGVCERVMSGSGRTPFAVVGYTHEKFLAQMDRVGFPAVRVPDISINEDVFGSPAAAYVVSRAVCATLDDELAQLGALLGEAEARQVEEQIRLGRANMGHHGPMASLALEIFVLPVAEGLPTIDHLRDIVRNPARAWRTARHPVEVAWPGGQGENRSIT